MLLLITYDVSTETSGGKKRLRKVAKQCMNYGIRVQNSVFECIVDPAQARELKFKLQKIVDPNTDSLRFYDLGSNYHNHIEHYGAKVTINVDDALIF